MNERHARHLALYDEPETWRQHGREQDPVHVARVVGGHDAGLWRQVLETFDTQRRAREGKKQAGGLPHRSPPPLLARKDGDHDEQCGGNDQKCEPRRNPIQDLRQCGESHCWGSHSVNTEIYVTR